MAEPEHPDFDLDTALSAELDGALGDYVADLGADPDGVRAALDAPAAVVRRAELTAARDALAVPPPLDDVTRRRLLAGAGVGTGRPPGEARGRRDRSWLAGALAAAAVTLVVLGGLFLATRGGGGSADRAGTAADGGATSAVTGDLGDVGRLDPEEIEGLLRNPDSSAARAPEAENSAQSDSGAKAAAVPGFDAATGGDATAVAACAAQYQSQGSIRFRASGTYQGRPAVVLGIDSGERTIVFVVAADDCNQVLYSASR